jgi:sulfite exporter TauE/SafE
MFEISLSIVGAGLILGLMHALDADHIMAVSVLSNEKPGLLRTFKFCLQWALGHGGVLLACALLLFGLGFELPPILLTAAEASVGVLLIVFGLMFFWRMKKQSISLHTHRHGDIVHSHWQVNDQTTSTHHQSEVIKEEPKDHHTPVFVGMLHGLAGSAPSLALVPIMAEGQLGAAVVYLVIFSLGVLFSMMMFGLGLGLFQQKMQQVSVRFFQFSRYLIASTSVLLGGFWLAQSI